MTTKIGRLHQMTWLTLDDDVVIIDTDMYIQSQPVSYDQVADIMETIRARGVPVRARIDVSRVRLSHVNILGVIDIIWDLHEHTYGENLIHSIELMGASLRVKHMWNAIQHILPGFVRSVVIQV